MEHSCSLLAAPFLTGIFLLRSVTYNPASQKRFFRLSSSFFCTDILIRSSFSSTCENPIVFNADKLNALFLQIMHGLTMRCGILDFSSCTGSDIAADIDHEDLIRHIDLPLMHGVSELLVAIADQNFHIQFLRTCTAHAQGITAELLQVCCDQNRALVEQLPCRCQGETALEAFQELDT